ncbi:hypothetical protein [Janthinobacterium sp. PSPC3-1]
MIQQWRHLADEQMAFHLLDRLNFQHFFGRRHGSPIPVLTTA